MLLRQLPSIATIVTRGYFTKLGTQRQLHSIVTKTHIFDYGNLASAYIQPRSYYRCDAHMNELPVPCGPWGPWYRNKQAFYNKILLGGLLWWLFSLFMMIYTNSIFLNWAPPPQPDPPSEMKEECED